MRCVFHATAGFLGRIDSETRCGFWAEEPVDHGFDPGRLIVVDLAPTPAAAAAKQIGWDEVQLDDCFTGPNGVVSGSTLGPRWPELRLAGVVYLEHGFMASLPAALRPACPPPGVSGEPHEYTTVVYWPDTGDPRAGNRYAGHHARILDERGTLARVAVYPPGRSQQPEARPVTMWIDLASPEHRDAGTAGLTTIGTGDGPKHGALFLTTGQL
ncbi:MAG TPA: hypothetical protein VNO54_09005 [Streptosporangiaceae bacterium]|nr:hypothetical protein [Streptosporangiaceae bacterium]